MSLEDYRTLFVVTTLGLVLISALPTVSMVVSIPGGAERFSELWVLGPTRMAEGYPFAVRVGEQYRLFVGACMHLIGKGYPVHAFVSDLFWYDVGSTERYGKLDNGLIEKHFHFLF